MDFTKREDALKEGLVKNEEEIQRWETYKNENKKASENMEMFIKKTNVEVMVPIGGGKAFMPGFIYHTNEVLVGHYNGLFSKCSVHKAQEIVEYRLKLARERLESLRKEKEMFQNKLDMPYTDGVLPGENQQEIIEDYDEAREKIWREEHKKRIREHKQKEKKEQEKYENDEKTHEDIMQILDQLELIEELDEELENLDINDNDMLEKLISGEIKLPPEKHRISHTSTNSNVVLGGCSKEDNNNSASTSKTNELDFDRSMEEIYRKYKSNRSKLDSDFTNNNNIPNSEDFRQGTNERRESDEDSDNDKSEEFSDIERDTVNMSIRQHIQYLKTKIKETESSLDTLKICNIDDYDRKVSLLELRDYLTDRMEILKDQNYDDEENDNVNVCCEIANKTGEKMNEKKTKKKKISFALKDEIHFIDENESVENMMQSNKKEKDFIVLDSNIYSASADRKENESENLKNSTVDRKSLILNEVEKSYNFVSENQSHQDFDLVNKIINSDLKLNKTFSIQFEHSEEIFDYPGYENSMNDDEKVIGSPADIYRMYPEFSTKEFQIENAADNKIPMQNNSIFSKEQQQKVSNSDSNDLKIGEEVHEKTGLLDGLKTQEQAVVEKPQRIEEKEQLGTKSILKNKNAVKLESHVMEETEQRQQKKKRSKNNEQDYVCYEMIVGDVVENPSKEPEPLPEGNFIDAHAPKKRISRFKQMRDNSVRTKS